MTAASPTCSHCGGALPPSSARCPFCGAASAFTAQSERPPRSAPDFAALEAHPDFARLLALDPVDERHARRRVVASFFLLVFALVCGWMAWRQYDSSGEVHPGALGMAAFGLFLFVIQFRKRTRELNEPTEAVPAMVRGARETDDGGGRVHHWLTLELAAGERRELPAPARMAEGLEEGDMGVAYLHARRLIDFRRLTP